MDQSMSPTGVVIVAVALTALPAFAQAQAIQSVTEEDLAGRTICWEDGWRITYSRDGSYFGTRGDAPAVNRHNARWSISGEGVVDVDLPNKELHQPMTVYPGGRFEIDSFSKRSGLRRTAGTVCR